MKKYRVMVAFSLDKMLYLPDDIVYAEKAGPPVIRLYNAKTRKTIGTMVESKFKTLVADVS